MKSSLSALVSGALFAALTSTASAALLFQVHPTGSHSAEITASGILDVATGSAVRIALEGATSIGNAGLADTFSGNFTFGGDAPDFVFVRGGTTNLVISFPSPFTIGDMPAGLLLTSLDVETFNPVSTTGNVIIDGNPSIVLGRFSVVNAFSVPEPGTAAVTVLALIILGLRSRKSVA